MLMWPCAAGAVNVSDLFCGMTTIIGYRSLSFKRPRNVRIDG